MHALLKITYPNCIFNKADPTHLIRKGYILDSVIAHIMLIRNKRSLVFGEFINLKPEGPRNAI